MKNYQVKIGTETMTIKSMSIVDAKQMAQYIKAKYAYKGKTSVKSISFDEIFDMITKSN
jgi:hypothetical protein